MMTKKQLLIDQAIRDERFRILTEIDKMFFSETATYDAMVALRELRKKVDLRG